MEETYHRRGKGDFARSGLVEAIGGVWNRAQAKRRKAGAPGVSRQTAAKPEVHRGFSCSGDGFTPSPAFLPGELSRPPGRNEPSLVIVEDSRTRR